MKLPFFQIAYMYPPIHTVGVLRNAEITRMLAAKGHPGTVITSKHTPVHEYSYTSVDVQRVNVLDYRSRKNKKANFTPSQSAKSSLAYKLFTKFYNSYPFNLFLGEGAITYIYNAYRKLDQLISETNGQGILISSFRPWADHQVAYLLKKKYPDLIWWCDWRDTAFEQRKSKPVGQGYQLKKLHQLNRQATVVTAVSTGVLNDLQPLEAYHEVIYNGATNNNSYNLDELITKKPHIVYTGSLYGEDRNPRPLFTAVSKLLHKEGNNHFDIEITYAGKDRVKWQSLLDEIDSSLPTNSLGMISHSEAMRLQKLAAINVVLTWSNPGQTGGLTMKIFEYLRAGQPILRIHDGPQDMEIDTVLAKAAAPVFTQNTADPSTDRLQAWISEQLSRYTINPIAPGFELADNLSNFYDVSLTQRFNLNLRVAKS